jgi:hypothetical protein
MLMVPVWCPAVAPGTKVTLTVHEELPASELPHELASGNAAELESILRLAAAVPLLVTVSVSAALVEPSATEPNACDVGDTVIGAVAVPDNEIVCVPKLVITVTEPVSEPRAVGTKVMLMVQFLPAATEDPQVFVWAKFVLAVMSSTVSAAVPLLVSRTDAALLLALTATEPNACDVAESVAVCA